MVQRSTSWSGATSLHETRNLAEIVLGSEPPVTWQILNGRTLLTQADADAAINYPTVVTSGGGTSWTAKITNVPNQDGAEDETVLSAGPWTMATTKGALQNLTSDVACTGGDAATLTAHGLPSDSAMYQANRRHEDHHISDDRTIWDATVVPWDRRVQRREDSGHAVPRHQFGRRDRDAVGGDG